MVILPFNELLSALHGWVSDVVADIFYIFFDITTKTFDIEELVDKLSVSTVINGDQIYSRFGSAVQFVDFVMPGGASKVKSREGIISDLQNAGYLIYWLFIVELQHNRRGLCMHVGERQLSEGRG